MTNQSSNIPVYQNIKNVIRQWVESGIWKPGALIPGEEKLSRDFGCARATVNRALRELANEGFLERRRKSGTRVALPVSRTVNFEIPRIRHEIEKTGATYFYTLLEREITLPPAMIRDQLKIRSDVNALHLVCLHFSNDIPFQKEDRWINLQTVPEVEREGFESINPNEWLMQHVPWTNGEHFLSAANANPEEAKLLNLAERDALFVIKRRTWMQDDVVTFVSLSYPGRFYNMKSL